MQQVNIYTQTTFKGVRSQNGAAGFVLELKTQKEPVTLSKMRILPNATPNEAELRVLIEALRRMTKKCELTIYTNSNYVAAGYKAGWVESWKKHEWKSVKGREISNVRLWQELDRLLEGHKFMFECGVQHEYRRWLTDGVNKKAEENENEQTDFDD